jgi:alpha-galactosidase
MCIVSQHDYTGENFLIKQVELQDRTDLHNNLVNVLSHSILEGQTIDAIGNLFILENADKNTGVIFIRRSPLPNGRAVEPKKDIHFKLSSKSLRVILFKADYEQEEELWAILPYSGGIVERTSVLHLWQRSIRPNSPLHRLPSFVTNTWGDRSQDAKLNETFMLNEIDCAAEIGADVVRMDDGWQNGLSGNSAFKGEMQSRGLTGFWSVSNTFWHINKERFPNGFEPILKHAKAKGIEIGLWYAPDSDSELINWENDAKTILNLHLTYGIRYFKIDGLDVTSPLAQDRIEQLLSTLKLKSDGKILVLLDCTGNHKRPGYLGALPYGNLFIENRYTDWGNYWPHKTLKNLWQLSHWIDPTRMRFEFLNNERNKSHKRYLNESLAPEHYPVDYLFASVMMSNPLGWFEASNLSTEFKKSLHKIVPVWRRHREAIFTSTIIPIGNEPNGKSWTGFMAINNNQQPEYLLCLREFSDFENFIYELPIEVSNKTNSIILAGQGNIKIQKNMATVVIANQPGYLLVKFDNHL